jgi:hypothetical protein
MDDQRVACGQHGERRATFVCQHLLAGKRRGFHHSTENPCEAWPDAWCGACDAVVERSGVWSDAAMHEADADIRMVCDICYECMRDRHWREPRGTFKRLLRSAHASLAQRQSYLMHELRIGDYPRIGWDQGAGQLTFSGAGARRLVTDFAFIGSLSTLSGSWLWSWANGSIGEAVKAPLRRVREYGVENGLLKLAAAHWQADEQNGWDMAAIAAHLLNAVGVYRCPGEAGFSYLLVTGLHTPH